MDRRKFLRILGIAGAASALPLKFNFRQGLKALGIQQAWAFQQSPGLTKFVWPLPGLIAPNTNPGDPGSAGSGIPVAGSIPDPVFPGVKFYQINVNEFHEILHPDFVDPSKPAYVLGVNPEFTGTKLWGYTDATTNQAYQRHLSGLIVAEQGVPVRIRFTNKLYKPNPISPDDPSMGTPLSHPLPVDTSIPMAGAEAIENRVAVHCHGGLIPWVSDGGPFDWWDPTGASGTSFLNGPGGAFLDNLYAPADKMKPGQADYLYPNDQSARLLWYHDHALGLTRLNAYAGVASGYLIDSLENRALEADGTLPPASRRIPLVFQDKVFIGPAGNPEPGGRGLPGDLWYPSVYDPDRWELHGTPPVPSVIAESFGDTMLVNGLVFPYVEVEQRKYRFTILNACGARFVRIKLVVAKSRDLVNPDSGEPTNYTNPTAALPMVQIGTEGGFLQAPVTLNGLSPASTLLMAPAERADVIVDFSNIGVGAVLLLYNDAPAPFPNGDPLNDYYPGSGNPTPTNPGMGPNTRTFMQFRVKARVGAADRPKPLILPKFTGSLLPGTGAYVRKLTLNEDFDAFGRLIQMIGGQAPGGTPFFDSGSTIEGPISNGTTEIWEIANLTGDTHPMHIHLVNWQIISRQPFDAVNYNGTPVYTGPARGPDPNERGWKETVRMNPGEVTRVIAKFDLPSMANYKFYGGAAITIPESPRFAGSGYNEYVWHCHILEHEEHDMMHTLAVV